jgi:acetyltransferase-like isoleucine patch superfamily enzyme
LSILTAIVRRMRRDPAYRFDPQLQAADVIALLWGMGRRGFRGLLLRPRLGSASGLLFVGPRAAIRNPRHIHAGRNLVIEDFAEVQGLSTGGVWFGDNVTVGRFAMIRPSGYYGRDLGIGLRVGDRSNIGAACYIGCSGGITIGADVMISPNVQIFSENHNYDDRRRPMKQQGVTRASVVIEDDCWIASGSIILAGVRIGTGSVVAAGAVVTSDVPPGSIVGGVPARIIGVRDEVACAEA